VDLPVAVQVGDREYRQQPGNRGGFAGIDEAVAVAVRARECLLDVERLEVRPRELRVARIGTGEVAQVRKRRGEQHQRHRDNDEEYEGVAFLSQPEIHPGSWSRRSEGQNPYARPIPALPINDLPAQRQDFPSGARDAPAGERLSGCFNWYPAVARARRRRPTRRVMASTIAAGSARPLPAISSAEPCATDENSTGVPIVSAAAPLGASNFAATCPWPCSITTYASY